MTFTSVVYRRRVIDILFMSAFGLPLLLLIFFTLLVSLLFFRQPFFLQSRLGKHCKPFLIYKFRSMSLSVEPPSDSGLASLSKSRITPYGSILRSLKLDELPQLFNVLNGSMSLVGPRPDVPGFIDKLPHPISLISNLRPGVTSLASILYRNESYLLTTQHDELAFYSEYIYPRKAFIEYHYTQHSSWSSDIALLFATLYPRFLSSHAFSRINLPPPECETLRTFESATLNC